MIEHSTFDSKNTYHPLSVHVALPEQHPLSSNISEALDELIRADIARNAPGIDDAHMIVASTEAITESMSPLPSEVRFIQLLDCGSGSQFTQENDLTVLNASPVLSRSVANWALSEMRRFFQSHSIDIRQSAIGVIGLGTLGAEIISGIRADKAITVYASDVRTPRQQLMDNLKVRRMTLDLLLSKCNIVFIALHHGPTADPLLSARELRLVSDDTLIINPSDPRVVSIKDIHKALARGRLAEYRSLSNRLDMDHISRHKLNIVELMRNNIQCIQRGLHPRGVVETVDYPSAGDPAFWSSKMHPAQTRI